MAKKKATKAQKIKAREAVRRAHDRKERASGVWGSATRDYWSKVRAYLKLEGWVEETRYNGTHGMMWEHVYKRPTGSVWHTTRGALEAQRKRAKKRKKL